MPLRAQQTSLRISMKPKRKMQVLCVRGVLKVASTQQHMRAIRCPMAFEAFEGTRWPTQNSYGFSRIGHRP